MTAVDDDAATVMTSHVADLRRTDVIILGLMSAVVVVVVGMMTTTASGHVVDCPPTCYCNAASGVIQCARRGLAAVPEVVPNGTRQMNLNGNRFRSPMIGRVNFTRYPGVARRLTSSGSRSSLEHLYISDCAIRIVQPGAFSDLVELRWLDLSDNLIETIVDSTFADLRLGHLFLNGNRGLILGPGSFAGSLAVSGLYLHDCALTRIDAATLAPLDGSLRTLWLQTNRIRRLEPEMQPLVTALVDFRSESNPLQCDCELAWFKLVDEDIRRRRRDDADDASSWPTCAGPPPLAGRAFPDLSASEFRCRLPVFGDIDADFDGRSGRLRCTAHGEPIPDVRWVRLPSAVRRSSTIAEVVTPHSWASYSSVDDDATVLSGHGVAQLVLTRVDDEFETGSADAVFACVASNAAGNVTMTVTLRPHGDEMRFTSGRPRRPTLTSFDDKMAADRNDDDVTPAVDVASSSVAVIWSQSPPRRSKSTSGFDGTNGGRQLTKPEVDDAMSEMVANRAVVVAGGGFVIEELLGAVIVTVLATVALIAGVFKLKPCIVVRCHATADGVRERAASQEGVGAVEM